MMTFFVRLLMVLFIATNCYAATVGDSIGGGTVFCVSDTLQGISNCKTEGSGEWALIASNEDLANFEINYPNKGITWSKKHSVTGAQDDNNGAANTYTIIRRQPYDDHTNNAAWLCHYYRGGKYNDWYLPSKNELNKLYIFAKNRNLIGKYCTGGRMYGMQCLVGGYDDKYNIYWSSTELTCFRENSAYFRVFSVDGNDNNTGKDGCFGVRAIRGFNSLTLQSFNTLEVEKMQWEEKEKQRIEAEEKRQQEEERKAEVLRQKIMIPIPPQLDNRFYSSSAK